MSKKTVQRTKEQIDIEMRNIVRKVSHRPIEEIVQIIRERMNVAADPDYIRELVGRK